MVADYALIDQQGKLSVLGIFQHVWLSNFPAVYPRTHLVLRVKGRRTEIDYTCGYVAAMGQQVGQPAVAVFLQIRVKNLGVVACVEGVNCTT